MSRASPFFFLLCFTIYGKCLKRISEFACICTFLFHYSCHQIWFSFYLFVHEPHTVCFICWNTSLFTPVCSICVCRVRFQSLPRRIFFCVYQSPSSNITHRTYMLPCQRTYYARYIIYLFNNIRGSICIVRELNKKKSRMQKNFHNNLQSAAHHHPHQTCNYAIWLCG